MAIKCMQAAFMLAFLIFDFAVAYCSITTPQHRVKIFSLQTPGQNSSQDLSELNNVFIEGISWRFRWQTVEPMDNQFNWQLIDDAVEMTKKAGKKAMVRIIAGMFTPTWIYQAGITSFDFSNTDLANPKTYKDQLRMPIPWDEVYLTQWQEFIQAFGQRYNGNPHIYSIQMTGGGTSAR